MNCLIIFPNELNGTTATLIDKRALYVIETHGARADRTLAVAILGGQIGTGKIVRCDPNHVVLECNFSCEPPSRSPIEVILAVPRPLTLKKVLHVAASIGLSKLTLLQSDNVVKSYLQSPLLMSENIQIEMIKGLEQVQDSILPKVEIHRSLNECLNLTANSNHNAIKILLHPNSSAALKDIQLAGCKQPIVAAIGPESGWSEREINYFTAAGFQKVNLGARILRVEHAFTVVLAQLQVLLG